MRKILDEVGLSLLFGKDDGLSPLLSFFAILFVVVLPLTLPCHPERAKRVKGSFLASARNCPSPNIFSGMESAACSRSLLLLSSLVPHHLSNHKTVAHISVVLFPKKEKVVRDRTYFSLNTTKRSKNIILDFSRSKMNGSQAIAKTKFYLRTNKHSIKRLIIITKSHKVLDLKDFL